MVMRDGSCVYAAGSAMTGHVVTVMSVRRWDDLLGAYVDGYRAACAGCRWRSRVYPLAMRVVAEDVGARHIEYHAQIARLTERQS